MYRCTFFIVLSAYASASATLRFYYIPFKFLIFSGILAFCLQLQPGGCPLQVHTFRFLGPFVAMYGLTVMPSHGALTLAGAAAVKQRVRSSSHRLNDRCDCPSDIQNKIVGWVLVLFQDIRWP